MGAFDRLLNLGRIEFTAWSNCSSAESLAIIAYHFLARPLWKLDLPISGVVTFLRNAQRFHTRIWHAGCLGEKDSSPPGYRNRGFHKSSLVELIG